MEEVAGRDWSSLPADLLTKLAGAVDDNIVDLYAFRAVCSSWRAAARQLRGAISSRSPLQAILSGEETVILHDPTRDRRLPGFTSGDFRGFSLCGSSHGSLILFKLHRRAAEIVLLDVATCFTVHLPPVDDTDEIFFASRIVLSSPLQFPGCTVVCFWGNLVAEGRNMLYCRAGDAGWRQCSDLSTYNTCDMLFVQGTLYALLRTDADGGCRLATVRLPAADDVAGDTATTTFLGTAVSEVGEWNFGWRLARAQEQVLVFHFSRYFHRLDGIWECDLAGVLVPARSTLGAAVFLNRSYFTDSAVPAPGALFLPDCIYYDRTFLHWGEIDGRRYEEQPLASPWQMEASNFFWVFPTALLIADD